MNLEPLISPSGVMIRTSPARVEELTRRGYRRAQASGSAPDLSPKQPRRRRKTEGSD